MLIACRPTHIRYASLPPPSAHSPQDHSDERWRRWEDLDQTVVTRLPFRIVRTDNHIILFFKRRKAPVPESGKRDTAAFSDLESGKRDAAAFSDLHGNPLIWFLAGRAFRWHDSPVRVRWLRFYAASRGRGRCFPIRVWSRAPSRCTSLLKSGNPRRRFRLCRGVGSARRRNFPLHPAPAPRTVRKHFQPAIVSRSTGPHAAASPAPRPRLRRRRRRRR
jgi:hypothetical protein